MDGLKVVSPCDALFEPPCSALLVSFGNAGAVLARPVGVSVGNTLVDTAGRFIIGDERVAVGDDKLIGGVPETVDCELVVTVTDSLGGSDFVNRVVAVTTGTIDRVVAGAVGVVDGFDMDVALVSGGSDDEGNVVVVGDGVSGSSSASLFSSADCSSSDSSSWDVPSSFNPSAFGFSSPRTKIRKLGARLR
jgi:hypothetical protein